MINPPAAFFFGCYSDAFPYAKLKPSASFLPLCPVFMGLQPPWEGVYYFFPNHDYLGQPWFPKMGETHSREFIFEKRAEALEILKQGVAERAAGAPLFFFFSGLALCTEEDIFFPLADSRFGTMNEIKATCFSLGELLYLTQADGPIPVYWIIDCEWIGISLWRGAITAEPDGPCSPRTLEIFAAAGKYHGQFVLLPSGPGQRAAVVPDKGRSIFFEALMEILPRSGIAENVGEIKNFLPLLRDKITRVTDLYQLPVQVPVCYEGPEIPPQAAPEPPLPPVAETSPAAEPAPAVDLPPGVPSPPAQKKKKMLLIGALAVILVLVGLGLKFFNPFNRKGAGKKGADQEKSEAAAAAALKEEKQRKLKEDIMEANKASEPSLGDLNKILEEYESSGAPDGKEMREQVEGHRKEIGMGQAMKEEASSPEKALAILKNLQQLTGLEADSGINDKIKALSRKIEQEKARREKLDSLQKKLDILRAGKNATAPEIRLIFEELGKAGDGEAQAKRMQFEKEYRETEMKDIAGLEGSNPAAALEKLLRLREFDSLKKDSLILRKIRQLGPKAEQAKTRAKKIQAAQEKLKGLEAQFPPPVGKIKQLLQELRNLGDADVDKERNAIESKNKEQGLARVAKMGVDTPDEALRIIRELKGFEGLKNDRDLQEKEKELEKSLAERKAKKKQIAAIQANVQRLERSPSSGPELEKALKELETADPALAPGFRTKVEQGLKKRALERAARQNPIDSKAMLQDLLAVSGLAQDPDIQARLKELDPACELARKLASLSLEVPAKAPLEMVPEVIKLRGSTGADLLEKEFQALESKVLQRVVDATGTDHLGALERIEALYPPASKGLIQIKIFQGKATREFLHDFGLSLNQFDGPASAAPYLTGFRNASAAVRVPFENISREFKEFFLDAIRNCVKSEPLKARQWARELLQIPPFDTDLGLKKSLPDFGPEAESVPIASEPAEEVKTNEKGAADQIFRFHNRPIVSPPATFETLQAAIDSAPEGEELVIRGTFYGSLRLSRNVSLIGSGSPRIESRAGPAVSLSGRSKVRNIRFSTTSDNYSETIRISGGSPSVYECLIQNQSGAADGETIAGILVDRSNPTIQMNKISSGGGDGIQVNGGNPLIMQNYIVNVKGAGISLYGSAQGRIEENTIENCSLSGIAVRASTAQIGRNQILRNRKSGILVFDGGKATILDNTLIGNQPLGIAVGAPETKAASAEIRENRFKDNLKGYEIEPDSTANTSGNTGLNP